jgi:hypothetical protein
MHFALKGNEIQMEILNISLFGAIIMLAATLLMMLEAGVSGFNQGRASAPMTSTSCTTTNGITNCFSF